MKFINKQELHKLFAELKMNKQEEAFNELYNECSNLVYRIAFSILKNKENSEDIKQMVFLKIWKKNSINVLWKMNKEILPDKNEASWLYAVTKNEAITFLKKQKNTINIDEIYYISDECDNIFNVEDKESYNKIISVLDKKEQEIVSLKVISNLSFRQISQILGEPIGTIQWRYYKAVHSLKILLSNLSMFIISVTIFASRILKKKENIPQTTIKNEVTENNEIASDTVYDNTKKNDTTETTAIKEDANIQLDNYDIGILGISGLFLVLTIVFGIIYKNHQQKVRKKKSK